jgi:hypothetical protein
VIAPSNTVVLIIIIHARMPFRKEQFHSTTGPLKRKMDVNNISSLVPTLKKT